jgi:hypothetical protein
MCETCRTHHPELYTHKPATKPVPEKTKTAAAPSPKKK